VALTGDDIGLEQQKLITNVQDLTEVESHVARQLLQEMNWNFESLAELYYEDTEKLLAKAGIAVKAPVRLKPLQTEKSGLHLEANGSFTCQVCFDSFEEEEVAASVRVFPSCGHAMCKGCWFQQLKTQIIDEGCSVRIACPGFSIVDGKVKRCNIILDERFVGSLLKEVELEGEESDAQRTRARYQKQLNDNYVNNNPCIKWCPVRRFPFIRVSLGPFVWCAFWASQRDVVLSFSAGGKRRSGVKNGTHTHTHTHARARAHTHTHMHTRLLSVPLPSPPHGRCAWRACAEHVVRAGNRLHERSAHQGFVRQEQLLH
jgi:hypothetical protein